MIAEATAEIAIAADAVVIEAETAADAAEIAVDAVEIEAASAAEIETEIVRETIVPEKTARARIDPVRIDRAKSARVTRRPSFPTSSPRRRVTTRM